MPVISIGELVILSVFVLPVLVVFLIAPSILVAKLAERQGRSFGFWLTLCLLLFWLPPLIVLAILRPKRETELGADQSADDTDR